MPVRYVIAGVAIGLSVFGFGGHLVFHWSPENSLARIGAALYAVLLIGTAALMALRKVHANDG
jgi:hypothetical protein